MTRTPDRSDSPAFYDPDHPDHHGMPTTGETLYWVEVLCDDGEQFGWGGWADNPEAAQDKAWADALAWGSKPVEITSCEVQP